MTHYEDHGSIEMGINEIDNNVRLEIVDLKPGSDGNIIGSHVAGRLPGFTDEELRVGLGEEVHDRIGHLFTRLASSEVPPK